MKNNGIPTKTNIIIYGMKKAPPPFLKRITVLGATKCERDNLGTFIYAVKPVFIGHLTLDWNLPRRMMSTQSKDVQAIMYKEIAVKTLHK